MSQVKALSCTCKHDFQDKTYGVNKRLHNLGEKSKKAVCTVCGEKKPI